MFWNQEIPTEKVSNPTNANEKKIGSYKILTSKYFRSTKYQRRKNLDLPKSHEKKFGSHEINTR